ncbi:hypothetical protein ACIPK7_05350 [Pseudomonas sp. NPDC086581]|uniref:hypothetical protein n=1 Tax=Pseudomonas sp. NPDC086581 TaxID=3364432 RepID=UPI0038286406
MARRIAYIGEPVLTLEQVAYQCRLEPEDLQQDLITGVIIPGVTHQCEQRSGAAIRLATYEEEWPEDYPSGHYLDVGQAREVLAVERVEPDGTAMALTVPFNLRRLGREARLYFSDGRPHGVLRIRYSAGVDLETHPSVRLWLLMQCGTAHEFRETLVAGTILAELPPTHLDGLLAEITVPPRF